MITTKKILLLISITLIFITSVSGAEKKVILAMDDFQVWWLEDVQEYMVQTHINNTIPITLGVIPVGLGEVSTAGTKLKERVKRWDANQFVEVAQHGYDHQVVLKGLTYSNQYNRLKKGNDLLKNAGVTPTSFVPPFGEADDNTIKVLKILGIHTFYDPMDITVTATTSPLILDDQMQLCKNDNQGTSCVFKDYATLKTQIESKITQKGVAVVLYHMQDFSLASGKIDKTKANQLVQYVNLLKQDGYTLMTAEQYYQSLHSTPTAIDNDKDGYNSTIDCNDNNANVWKILAGYTDNDKDSYGTGTQKQICSGNSLPTNASTNNLDCNDNNINVNPGKIELCNNTIDDNCNGVINEVCVVAIDNDKDGYNSTVDCNDNNANIHPGATETVCNGIDNDCDGAIDENYTQTATNCGVGICAKTGFMQCVSGQLVNSCTAGLPQTEICTNNLDDDCDGTIDEGCVVAIDNDKDGYNSTVDCNDNNANIHPGATETVCNGIDNDCDGAIDENCNNQTQQKIVLLAIDDFQVWWLEDEQEYIVQKHITNNIPVTLGVIPSGIEDDEKGTMFTERIKRWDASPIVEVAQHGYDHEVVLKGLSYSTQYTRLKKGNDLMKSIGLTPTSFVPPFGEADDSTIQVLRDLGLHTFYDPVDMVLSSTANPLILDDQMQLCQNENEGVDCVFKNYNTLKSEIDSKINQKGVAIVLYHIQDFSLANENIDTAKGDQLVQYAKKLQQDGYTLMTVEQYYQTKK